MKLKQKIKTKKIQGKQKNEAQESKLKKEGQGKVKI